ncbi:MAG: aminopeptidase P family protein [Planctomycetota bacterium]|nr:aminopeptidase P family protein [Planctomycetota bacterium]
MGTPSSSPKATSKARKPQAEGAKAPAGPAAAGKRPGRPQVEAAKGRAVGPGETDAGAIPAGGAEAAIEPKVVEGKGPYAARLARLSGVIAGQSLGHLLVTNPLDVAYLTGFLGGDSYLLVGADGKSVLLSDFRFEEELEPIRKARLARVVIRSRGLLDATADLLIEARASEVGLQAEHVTLAQRESLVKALGARGLKSAAKALAATTGLIAGMREIKDAGEVRLIRKAIEIQEQALLAVLPTIQAGQPERVIAALLEAEMKSLGSSAPGFETIIAARANGSLPHYRAGDTKVALREPLLIDWGAVYKGYHGDMTRTFSLVKWPAEIAEIYSVVLEAHEASAAALKAGVTTGEVDAIARGIIDKAGFGERFGHGLGHGIGLQGHEDPRLSPMASSVELRAGHVVTIEPGIYLPGVGGVRIEDCYLVTEKGATNLCSLPKDAGWSTLT